jgi:creatinine deaminase
MSMSAGRDDDRRYTSLAFEQAREAYAKGSIPVGSVMVRDGAVMAVGRNRSQETNDPTSHAEIDCIRNGGLRDGYGGVTLYTTLSPCMMCSGAMLFLGVPRVVIGERETYRGNVDLLLERGLEVVLLDDPDCIALMRRFIAERGELWHKITAGEAKHTS